MVAIVESEDLGQSLIQLMGAATSMMFATVKENTTIRANLHINTSFIMENAVRLLLPVF